MTDRQISLNPANGDILNEYPLTSSADVKHAIARAEKSFAQWRIVSHRERSQHLLRLSETLLAKKQDYARLITLEMGKPLKEAIAEVEKCAGCAKYFAENGEAFLADQPIATEYRKSYVTFQPLGIILGVMPWNFPFWQVLRFAVPSLMAGNVALLKHASNTPGCALALANLFDQAGFPPHVFQALLIPGSRVEEVISHPSVAAVSLTGSTEAGKSVAALAGKYLKKAVLELGGSDPYIVLEDADIEKAIATCTASRLLNGGQSCISAKRLIVVEAVRERFEQGLLANFKKQVLGDPLDALTTVGPMSRVDLRDQLHAQVEKTIAKGAACLTGGKLPAGKGAFYPPTILTGIKSGMPAYAEELFGPVALIFPAKDEAEALHIANDTTFGLGGAVFTQDLARGERIARERVESGSCFVNMMVRSDARLPFGGVKESGYGRELSSFGIHEFVNIKTIVVA